MYVSDGTDYRTTDESIALWQQHVHEYVAARLAEQ